MPAERAVVSSIRDSHAKIEHEIAAANNCEQPREKLELQHIEILPATPVAEQDAADKVLKSCNKNAKTQGSLVASKLLNVPVDEPHFPKSFEHNLRKRGPSSFRSLNSSDPKQIRLDEDKENWPDDYECLIDLTQIDDTGSEGLFVYECSPAETYERWTETNMSKVQTAIKLSNDLRGLDWCNDSEILEITWQDLAALRRSAEVFAACGFLSIAFKLHHLVWRRLSISDDCEWGDLKMHQCRQLVYCLRSAEELDEKIVVQHLLESYVAKEPSNAHEGSMLLLRKCLTLMQGTEDEEGHSEDTQQTNTGWNFDRQLMNWDDTRGGFGISKCSKELCLLSIEVAAQHVTASGLAACDLKDPSAESTTGINSSNTNDHFSTILVNFFEWCSRKIVRSSLSSWSHFGPLSWVPAHLPTDTREYLNTLHLFSFFWVDKDLRAFSRLLEHPNAASADYSMMDWAYQLRSQIGLSLADILWTISSTIVRATAAEESKIMGLDLFDAVKNAVKVLNHMPRDDFLVYLRGSFLPERVELDETVESEAFSLLSDLVWEISSMPKVPKPYDASMDIAEVCATVWDSFAADTLARTLAESCASGSLASMRRIRTRSVAMKELQEAERLSGYSVCSGDEVCGSARCRCEICASEIG